MNRDELIRSALTSGADGLHDGWEMWCPGCEDIHAVGPAHQCDGNLESPTLQGGSVLVMYGNRPDDKRCHSFVRSGHWEFLGDCTHPLAGQTVPMVPIPEGAR